MVAASPTTLPVPRTVPVTERIADEAHGWKAVLHNDDNTPFDVVIYALQRAAGLSLEVAEMVALEAHSEGVAIVKRGLSEEDAQIICGGLRRWSRVPNLCGGVVCEAVPDEA